MSQMLLAPHGQVKESCASDSARKHVEVDGGVASWAELAYRSSADTERINRHGVRLQGEKPDFLGILDFLCPAEKQNTGI
jgi:hypothetical protein